MMEQAQEWSWSVGVRGKGRVRVYERADKGMELYLIWTAEGKQRQRCLARLLRTSSGRIVKETERWAIKQAQGLHDELCALAAGYTSADRQRSNRDGITIAEGIRLVQDPAEGKYPVDTAHRREVLRSLQYAKRVWGPNRSWQSLRKRDIRSIARRRMTDLIAQGERGARSAEKMVEHIVAVSNWLRDNEYIPEGTCVASSKWTAELYEDWRAITGSDRDYEADQPRHTLQEARAILGVAGQVDPRFKLLLALGADLRLGQVVRARRSQLDMVEGTFKVPSRGRKKGTTILLTPGQRTVVEESLQGYLRELEGSAADYPLFPGRFTTRNGQFVSSDGPPMHKQTIYRWFQQAELLAGVPHLTGRCAYGLRRAATDAFLANGASLKALQNNGGWESPKIPTEKYAARETAEARQQAALLRALWRGEGDPETAPKPLPA